MKWDTAKLGDITDSCLGKMLDQNKNRGTYQSYLANNNVRWGTFELDDLSQMKFLDTEEERYGLKYGDLVICEGGEPGRCAIWKEQLPNMKIQKALHRVRAHDSLDIRFLYYWFLDAGRKGALDQYFTGATIKHMPGDKLKSIVIDKPPLLVQHKIADILSTYDDLIENNQKQIKLLEEAAQRLYKEWFVDLRFPGHEKTPIVDGVPEGWKKTSIEECLELHIGGGWGKETPTGNYLHRGRVIRGTDIDDIKASRFNDIPCRFHTENDINKRALRPNDIVFELSNGNIDNIGRSLLIDKLILERCGDNTICASFCKLLRPLDPFHAHILYLKIQYMQASGEMSLYKKNGANGINNFAFEDFLAHELLLPVDKSILEVFCFIVQKIGLVRQQSTLLIEARDRLLPKLMSGEMEV